MKFCFHIAEKYLFLFILCEKYTSVIMHDCTQKAEGKQMFFKTLQLCMACRWLTQICAVNLLHIYFVVNFLVCYLQSLY